MLNEERARAAGTGSFETVSQLVGTRGGVVTERTPGQRQVPALPQCCVAHRMAAIGVLETLVFNDSLATFDHLLDASDGCALPGPDAIDELRHGYREWLLGHLGDAIDDACALLEAEVAA